MQAVIGLNAVLGQVRGTGSIDFLESPTAQAIEALQGMASRSHYTFSVSTSVPGSTVLKIDPTTRYERTHTEWVEGEFYLYGEVTDMGGKAKANIHIHIPGERIFVVSVDREFLKKYEDNPLYKIMGVVARGRQDPVTGEIDHGSLVFREFIEYRPEPDHAYLDSLTEKAAANWADVEDPDQWLHELRGV
jgi:hypothetical protein